MAGGAQPFSLLVKPCSADCNLACSYCFYLPKRELYPGVRRPRMSQAVLRRLIGSYMATEQPQYAFGWQGGEPTLMGVEFFRTVVSLQQEHGRPGSVVANGLQTNATLITPELAELFAEYRFLLGVSLDGPEELHDVYRRGRAGRGSHRRVLQGIDLLERHRVEYNALVTVNAANAGRPAELYRYLVERGIRYQQYIPIVEFDAAGEPLPFSVGGEQWGAFLAGIFAEWLPDAGRVSVRLFDSILAYLVDGERNACPMGSDCRQYFLVEHNGDVYPCDFFAEESLRLGNVMENDWSELRASAVYRDFGLKKSSLHPACRECPYLELCAGDCLKHRLRRGQDPRQLSWLCRGWKRFYAEALPRLRRMARGILRERSRAVQARARGLPPAGETARGGAAAVEGGQAGGVLPAGGPPGRNTPCPCGSGRKYKHCHGAA